MQILALKLVIKINQRIQRGAGGPDLPPENHKNIGFLSNTCPDTLTNHKATKPAFNSASDDGPLILIFGYSLPLSTNQTKKGL